jgi:hypothetical protein
MAENTLTNLIPDLFEAVDIVSRELVGLIPSVTMSNAAEQAAKDETIRWHVAPAGNGVDITPAMAVPEPTGQTIGSGTMSISKSRAYEFGFNGDAQAGLNNGPGYQNVRADMIAQGIRGLVNEVETDLAALHIYFSRAYGTAGATPFGTANDYTDASEVLRILKDNGAPVVGNQLVFDTAAGAKFLGKQSAVNSAGTDSLLRQGVLLDVAGMPLRESAQIKQAVTVGTASNATTDDSGYAVGDTVITLASAGTGTLIAGDVITFAGDSNKYVVTSGDTDVSNGGTITLAEPGLRVAMSAATKAITVVAAATRNMCFNKSAIVLAARLPKNPMEGDLALDRQIIVDPRSGLPFEFSMYPGYRKVRYEVAMAWGVKVVKPEHTAILLG